MMTGSAKRQTLQLWIALMAILFSVLAPAVSHALAASDTAVALAMCTVAGDKTPGGGKAPADAMHGMQHCAFCHLHGGGDALPTAPAVALALSAGRDLYPSLFYHAPRALPVWTDAHPRAPPVLA